MSAAVKMKSLYPDFVLRIETDKVKSLVDMVYSKAADLAFLPTKPDITRAGFQCSFFMNDTLSLWTHRDNPVLTCENLALSNLQQSSLIVSKNRTINSWCEAVAEVFRNVGVTPELRQRNLDTVVEYILDVQPDEVIALPKHIMGIAPHVTNPDLRKVPINSLELTYNIWALYPSQTTNPFIARFLDICKQVASGTVVNS